MLASISAGSSSFKSLNSTISGCLNKALESKFIFASKQIILFSFVKINGLISTIIEGVGFRATIKGNKIDLELGYSHPILHDIPEGVTVTVADNVKIHVEGADKQKVGQMAAEIKSFYPVEPYKGKGVRILGEYVRRKEGKKSA